MNDDDSVGGAGAAPPPRAKRAPWGQPPAHRATGPRAGGPALEAMYQLLLWLIPKLEQFPRSQKFLLADRLQTQALAVLDDLINATYSRDRQGLLRAANLGLERMRFGMRLAKDLHHLDLKAYAHVARQLDEVGRLVGGWLKADRQMAAPHPTGLGHGAPG